MKHDIGTLEARLKAYDHKKRELNSLESVLNPFLHRPGWTTPAEWSFMELAMDILEQHVDIIASIEKQLIVAAEQVGK